MPKRGSVLVAFLIGALRADKYENLKWFDKQNLKFKLICYHKKNKMSAEMHDLIYQDWAKKKPKRKDGISAKQRFISALDKSKFLSYCKRDSEKNKSRVYRILRNDDSCSCTDTQSPSTSECSDTYPISEDDKISGNLSPNESFQTANDISFGDVSPVDLSLYDGLQTHSESSTQYSNEVGTQKYYIQENSCSWQSDPRMKMVDPNDVQNWILPGTVNTDDIPCKHMPMYNNMQSYTFINPYEIVLYQNAALTAFDSGSVNPDLSLYDGALTNSESSTQYYNEVETQKYYIQENSSSWQSDPRMKMVDPNDVQDWILPSTVNTDDQHSVDAFETVGLENMNSSYVMNGRQIQYYPGDVIQSEITQDVGNIQHVEEDTNDFSSHDLHWNLNNRFLQVLMGITPLCEVAPN